MARFLRLKNVMVHIPSLSSISMQSNWFGRPSLSLYYHNSKENTKISYSQWAPCEADFNRVKSALAEVEKLLSQIPLTEVKDVVIKKEPVSPAAIPLTEVKDVAKTEPIVVE